MKALVRRGFLGCCLLLSACASYQQQVDEARRVFSSSPDEAVKKLEPLAKEEGRDQLVYMLDHATALQMAGRYEESSREYIRAERVADAKDYDSISKVTGSLLLSETMVQYKGDDFEKVLINGMNALNFLELGQLDSALVEVRRVNEKLYKLKSDGKSEFNQSPLAFYLGAMIWEADRKFDDAYIAYKNAYDVAPGYWPLREDLVRSAQQAQRPEEVARWRKAFPEVSMKPEWKERNRGEVVLIFLNGWGPRKYPRPENFRFPYLKSVFTPVTAATMILKPTGSAAPAAEAVAKETTPTAPSSAIATATTASIYSVDDVAIKALDADFARLLGSRVAGIATKAVVADQVRQKDQLLGAVTWLALNLSDQADLRQWSTLPKSFNIARSSVPAGNYSIELSAPGSTATSTRDIKVLPGRKTFVVWRLL